MLNEFKEQQLGLSSGEGRPGCPGTSPFWGLLEHLQVGARDAHCLLRGMQQWVPSSQLTTGTSRRNLALLLGACEPSTLRLFPGIPSTLLFT